MIISGAADGKAGIKNMPEVIVSGTGNQTYTSNSSGERAIKLTI
ncbi:MAG: hypothetical protein R2827_08890 [Bdellovibrionales bacterium]